MTGRVVRGRRLRRLARWILRLRGSPEAVGLGVAIGTFVAFTPTIGFQMLLAALLATLLNANRPAALVPVWITNPLTIPPIYGFTYWVGSWFRAGPSPERVREVLEGLVSRLGQHDAWSAREPLSAVLALSRDVLVPLWIGGLLVGVGAGALAYLPAAEAVRRIRQLRQRRRQARRRRAAGAREQQSS